MSNQHKTPPIVELRNGAMRLALRPDLGGSIAGLWLDDLPVLRSIEPAALEAARAGGCFVLVPYSNRLGHCRFPWRERDYRVQLNSEVAAPHALHGAAWQRAWVLESSSTATATLEYTHPSDADWPFAFHVSQRFDLEPGALNLALTATNIDARTAPMGLGWHPYFPKRSRSRMHLELSERWDNDAEKLPLRKQAQAGIDADVGALDFDHCFEGWRGAARLRDERLSLRLSSTLDRVVIYTPPTQPYFCVEPVSHVNNALNMAEPEALGIRALAPGESMSVAMRIEVERI